MGTDSWNRTWKGQFSPRSATGRSSLVEPLPHHISCDALHVNFRADPDAIAQFLPPGVEPLEGGEGWAMIAEMAKVSAENPDQAWQDPARSTYNEGLVGFYCRFGERVGRYSSHVWVNRDWSMGMGSIFGWSKRLADVDRTRLQLSNPAFRDAERFTLGGTVSRYGNPVMKLSVSIARDAPLIDALPGHAGSTFLYRYVPSPGPDVADVEQLLELPLGNIETREIRAGDGTLSFAEAPDEELAALGKLEVTGGFAYQRGWTTAPQARLLHDYQEDCQNLKTAQT
ncbi:acetoacetate decarboxylase family protein [Breoghania sp.]|uniref:acetoacetate decarboxylase family protein n=1 Tax=Breoghania sp. TaxID=2065378 RepID=UPI002AA7FE5D|nr:acetoacetate decarboxylase family protein [Breoghania sp.]